MNNSEFKSAARSAFEAYQQALRRAIQSRQVTIASVTEAAAS
jgi:hypothetical protein